MGSVFNQMKPLTATKGEPEEVAAQKEKWAQQFTDSMVVQQNLETRLTEQLSAAHLAAMDKVRKISGAGLDDKNYSKISGPEEAKAFADVVSATLKDWYVGDVIGLGKLDKKFDVLVGRALAGDLGFNYNSTLSQAENMTMTPDAFNRSFSSPMRQQFGRTMQQEAMSALGTIESRTALANQLSTLLPAGTSYKNVGALQPGELYSDAMNLTLQGPDSYIESNPDRFTTSTE